MSVCEVAERPGIDDGGGVWSRGINALSSVGWELVEVA